MAFMIYKKSSDGKTIHYEKIKPLKLSGRDGLIARHAQTTSRGFTASPRHPHTTGAGFFRRCGRGGWRPNGRIRRKNLK